MKTARLSGFLSISHVLFQYNITPVITELSSVGQPQSERTFITNQKDTLIYNGQTVEFTCKHNKSTADTQISRTGKEWSALRLLPNPGEEGYE